MNTRRPTLKVPACILSAILFTSLMPLAHGGPIVGNLVFAEVSSTVLIETLDGNPIGNWVPQGSGPFSYFDSIGDGRVTYPGAFSTQEIFNDPMNPDNYFDLVNNGTIFSDITYAMAVSFTGGFVTIPVPGPATIPYSLATPSEVQTPNGLIAVNITVNGPASTSAPDGAPTVGLLFIACVGLVVARRQFNAV